MSNRDRYLSVFCDVLQVTPEDTAQGLKYQEIPTWDSVGHMALIAALEDEFGVELEVDDIIDFSSMEYGVEILAKYGVDISIR